MLEKTTKQPSDTSEFTLTTKQFAEINLARPQTIYAPRIQVW